MCVRHDEPAKKGELSSAGLKKPQRQSLSSNEGNVSRRHSGDTNNTNGDTQNVKKEPIRQKGLDQHEITQGSSKKGKGLKRGHNTFQSGDKVPPLDSDGEQGANINPMLLRNYWISPVWS